MGTSRTLISGSMSTPPILEGLLALVVFLYPLAKMDKIREFNGVYESGKSTTGLCMFTTTIRKLKKTINYLSKKKGWITL